MRVLLVILHENLERALTSVLNPENNYCAIVTDEIEPAAKTLEKLHLPKNLIHPMYELKECIENYYYDCAFLYSDGRTIWGDLAKQMQSYGLPLSKFVHFGNANNTENHLLLERAMRYYREHSKEFEMFATGISYAQASLDATQFKLKLFNFGRGSQDLYYDYQIAKRVLTLKAKVGANIRYALIGLAPYSFHYDESKSWKFRFRLTQYYFALQDLHNFEMSVEQFANLFKKEFLLTRLTLDNFDVNNIFISKVPTPPLNWYQRIEARTEIDKWKNKNYPATRAENIKILDDYLTLCLENNVRPVLFTTPLTQGYIKYFSREKLDEFYFLVSEAKKKHTGTRFLDGFVSSSIFPDSDFKDNSHLNLVGAAKFSAAFNSLIERLEE